MNRRRPPRTRRIKLAEGDDWIEPSAWGPPISNYKRLVEIHQFASLNGLDLPLTELQSILAKEGQKLKFTAASNVELDDFLEELLWPYLDISGSPWGGDSPGLSGYYKTAYLKLGNLRAVNKRLKLAENFLNSWRDLYTPQGELIGEGSAEKTEANNLEKGPSSYEESAQWEQQIADEILAHVKSRATEPLARFHFLSASGNVFFITMSGWWHSIPGDGFVIREKLRSAGVNIIDANLKNSDRGWKPYFARVEAEEAGYGWFDDTAELDTGNDITNRAMVEARKGLKGKLP